MCRRALQWIVTACSDRRRRRVKRYLSYLVIVFNFFLCGFEYGVIFPTAMDYLQSLGAAAGRETTLFGLLIVSYGAANIVGGYVGGLWADMFIETRPLLVLAALPQIIGNALYFFAASPTGAIVSHALSGLGSGANTAMLAEVTRTTSLTHRTSVIGVMTFSRQLGIVCGPAVGAYLTNMPDIFRHRVTLLNAPGLLLTFCYLVYLVMLTLFYANLTVDKDESGGGGEELTRSALSAALARAVRELNAPAMEDGSETEQSETKLKQGKRQRRADTDSSESPETTPKKRQCPETQPGPTPANTPMPQARMTTPTGAATHTPQRPLVLSLPQPSPNQCSSWPPYRSLATMPEDDTDRPASSASRVRSTKSSKSSDPPGPSETEQPAVVWPHTPDHHPPSRRCPHRCPPSPSVSQPVSVVREWRELLCWPIAALLFCNFTAYLTQTSLEALLPALVERDLRLEIDATGKIFIAGGVIQCLVLACIFLTPLLPFMQDQRLITTGLVVMIAAHAQLLATIHMLRDSAVESGGGGYGWSAPSPSPPPRDQHWFWIVLVGSGVQFFGYPLVNSVVTSFMSKMLSRGAQGVGAAGLRLSMCVGLMLGPVWGSGMLHRELPLLLLPLAVLLLALLIFCAFERGGAFAERMREAAVVDRVTPRVCAAPRRVRTISALSQIRAASREGVSDDPAGGDGRGDDKRQLFD